MACHCLRKWFPDTQHSFPVKHNYPYHYCNFKHNPTNSNQYEFFAENIRCEMLYFDEISVSAIAKWVSMGHKLGDWLAKCLIKKAVEVREVVHSGDF